MCFLCMQDNWNAKIKGLEKCSLWKRLNSSLLIVFFRKQSFASNSNF